MSLKNEKLEVIELDKAIQAIEDFTNTSSLPFPQFVKELMIKEEFPALVKKIT